MLASGLTAKFWVPSSGAAISISVCDTAVVDSGHRVGDGVGDDVVIEERKLDW